ncbi:chemotaxis protein [Anopheles sinensis]|uniref:Chemotaxis protein n=1 Tax=Anopheles sinensis TaxID=74873 RepID=A0A084W128_ANOSI|nr:chemotaxis protein [Anopheles sinensis]
MSSAGAVNVAGTKRRAQFPGRSNRWECAVLENGPAAACTSFDPIASNVPCRKTANSELADVASWCLGQVTEEEEEETTVSAPRTQGNEDTTVKGNSMREQ